MLNKLERWGGRFAVSNLTAILTIALTVTYGMRLLWPETVLAMAFSRELIFAGEIWRIFSFIILAPGWHPLFAAFGLYLFYLMGSTLEAEWGETRYNLFVFIGYLATLLAAFLTPDGMATNQFLLGSVFLTFAYLYPDFQIMLFFVLPVRIKWLALVTWLLYGWVLLTGGWTERALVVAATANFLLFFGGEIFHGARAAKRKMEFQAKQLAADGKPFHTCAKCGLTDHAEPTMEFRVCEVCHGAAEYCAQHLDDHEHLAAPVER